MRRLSLLTYVSIIVIFGLAQTCPLPVGHAVEDEPTSSQKTETDFKTELIRGKVQWLAAALKEDFGISTVPEISEHMLALKTKDGELFPIVENSRGRAFRKDERLRKMDVEIVARRYAKQPLIQVLRIYELDGGKKFEVDYWCDVCAIPMYETGPCSCCQDHNRIRKRKVDGKTTTEVEKQPHKQGTTKD